MQRIVILASFRQKRNELSIIIIDLQSCDINFINLVSVKFNRFQSLIYKLLIFGVYCHQRMITSSLHLACVSVFESFQAIERGTLDIQLFHARRQHCRNHWTLWTGSELIELIVQRWQWKSNHICIIYGRMVSKKYFIYCQRCLLSNVATLCR